MPYPQSFSRYPHGFQHGVTIREIPILNAHSKNVWWVDSNGGGSALRSTGQGTFNRPFVTLAQALTVVATDPSSGSGDIIMMKAGHAETVTAAGGINVNVAKIAIRGLGEANNRPKFTFTTAAGASITFTAAEVTMQNFIAGNGSALNNLTGPFDVQAAGVYLDFEWTDFDDTHEAITVVNGSTTACARLTVNLKYNGRTGGSACAAPIKLNGCAGGYINLDFYGKASTSVVNFVTTACTNIEVTGYTYNSGTTDGSKNVVDTITGSTWYCNIHDGSAGYQVAGGSGSAIANQTPSSQAVPTANAVTNTLIRDVVGNKTDAAVVVVGTTNSLVAYLKGLVNLMAVQAADSTNNVQVGDVVGNKSDAAQTTVGTTRSLMGYLKGLLSQNGTLVNTGGSANFGAIYGDFANVSLITRLIRNKNVSTKAMANTDFTGTATRFTITGGPIIVRHLGLLITTVLPAGANTLLFQLTPTGGAAAALCAATDTAAAAVQTLFTVDGTKATALVKSTDPGIGISGASETKMPLILSPGIVQTVFSAGPPASGAGTVYMEWEPLADGVTVVAS